MTTNDAMTAIEVTVIKEDNREGRTTKLKGQTLWMWTDNPQMPFNQDKVMVSKQPNPLYRFAIRPECLKIA